MIPERPLYEASLSIPSHTSNPKRSHDNPIQIDPKRLKFINEHNTNQIINFAAEPNPDGETIQKISKIIEKQAFNPTIDKGRKNSLFTTLLADRPFYHPQLIPLLAKNGCNLNFQDQDDDSNLFPGNTPLIWIVAHASYKNAISFIEEGLPCGLDVNLKDLVDENNALLLCLKKGVRQDPLAWEHLVHLLLTYTIDLNDTDRRGNTAMHLACFRREEEVVKKLLLVNANPHVLNNKGQSPKDLWELEVKDLSDKSLKILGNMDEGDITFDLEERNQKPSRYPFEESSQSATSFEPATMETHNPGIPLQQPTML